LRFTTRRRRAFVSTLFSVTFCAAVLTVSASNILPCPVRPERALHADDEDENFPSNSRVTITRRPSRWIQEKDPTHP
ncbi:hypothetical protein FISHEDRAFT_7885, partial [Fistulina hepatica ATCC 64428]